MSFIKGDASILYIKDDGVYVPIGCLTDNSLEESVEILRTTTRVSGGWSTGIPTTQRATITFEGYQPIDRTGVLTHNDLRLVKRSKTLIEWRIGEADGDVIHSGYGYIVDISESAPAGDFITFSATIQVFGVPNLVFSDGALWQDGDSQLFQDGTSFIYN